MFTDASPEYQTLLAIYRANGELTATAVVNEAKKKTSPIHNQFTWDDNEAARLHRLEEARYLIRRCRIVIERTDDQPPRRIRVFHHESQNGSYGHIEDIVTEPERLDHLKERLTRELIAMKTRIAGIKEYSEVYEAIEKATAA